MVRHLQDESVGEVTVVYDSAERKQPRYRSQRRYQVEYYYLGRWNRQTNARSSFHTKFAARQDTVKWNLLGFRSRIIDTKEQ